MKHIEACMQSKTVIGLKCPASDKMNGTAANKPHSNDTAEGPRCGLLKEVGRLAHCTLVASIFAICGPICF